MTSGIKNRLWRGEEKPSSSLGEVLPRGMKEDMDTFYLPVRLPSSITRSLTLPREMISPAFAWTKLIGTLGVDTTGGMIHKVDNTS
jgi:hypothetical protein